MKNMFLSSSEKGFLILCGTTPDSLPLPDDNNLNSKRLDEAPSAVMDSTCNITVHTMVELYVGWFLYSYTFNPILSSRKMASVTGLYMVPAFKFLQANWAYGNCKPVQRPRINKTIMVFAKLRPESLTALSSLLNKL